MQADKKKKESMSMWKIILIVNLAVYILSFVIPSGAYQRDGKMAVPGTYEVVEKTYLNPVDVILAVGDTVYSSFGKLFVTLIIMGGMMGIVNSTGVLDRALGNLIHRLKDKALAIIPIYVFATALLGCVGSMISTVILFVPLGLLIARKLRADRTFAVGLVILGSFTGFMSSPINPLTGVMGQEIAGLVPYSGAGLRTIVTILNVAVVSAYLVWWAKRCFRKISHFFLCSNTILQDCLGIVKIDFLRKLIDHLKFFRCEVVFTECRICGLLSELRRSSWCRCFFCFRCHIERQCWCGCKIFEFIVHSNLFSLNNDFKWQEMLFVVKCEIVLFQTFLCQHGVQYGNIRRNIPGTVDKKAVQQFFECNVQGINRLFNLCLCAADVIAGNRLFVKFPVGVQQFGCSWQIIIHHFLQIRCNFRMNPYLIKNPLHQLFHFVQLAGNFFSRNVVIAFPDMADIGLTFVDQLLAFIRYFVFFLFLFYDFFLSFFLNLHPVCPDSR